jgi:hypothetical protein
MAIESQVVYLRRLAAFDADILQRGFLGLSFTSPASFRSR